VSQNIPTALRRIERPEKKGAQFHQDLAEYRTLGGQQFDAGRLAGTVNEPGPSSAARPTQQDDDTHYFSSYCETVLNTTIDEPHRREKTSTP
jgi:protein arginine N-methyltransferase 3